ncbi:hypothetical protein [Senegalimassilia anaerobia]
MAVDKEPPAAKQLFVANVGVEKCLVSNQDLMVNIIKGRTNADFFLEVALVLVVLESTNLLAVEPYAFVPLAQKDLVVLLPGDNMVGRGSNVKNEN